MSEAQAEAPASHPAAPGNAYDAVDAAFAQVEGGATAPDAEPAKAEPDAPPKEEAKAEPPKRESGSDRVAKAIREARAAERKAKEATQAKEATDKLRGEVEPILGAISKKDLDALQEALEARGITFADLVKHNLGKDTPADAGDDKLRAEVEALKADREAEKKAAEEREAKRAQDEYATNLRVAVDSMERAAKAKPDDFELCSIVGEPAYLEALALMDEVHREAGAPAMSQAEWDASVEAALSVVEGRIEARESRFLSAKKLKAKLGAPQTSSAQRPEPSPREQTGAVPNTVTSTIGARGVTPAAPAQRRGIPSADEAIDDAFRQVGLA